MIQKTLSSQS